MPVKTFTNKAEGIYYPMLEIIVKTVSLNIYSLFIAIEKGQKMSGRNLRRKHGEVKAMLFYS